MQSRTAHIRRSRKFQRLQRRLGAVVMLGVVGGAAGLYVTRSPEPAPLVANDVSGIVAVTSASVGGARAMPVVATTAKPARRVYPYSIVPGGVAGRDDVVRMMKMDKVVAAHYASFEVDKASVTTVSKPRAVFVSYRKGDKVYWTAKKHTLAAGETLLTDGSNEIRGRCGNRVSDVAMLPVEAAGPSERELDAASDEAGESDAGNAQNVSFAADSLLGGAGHAFALANFPNGAGLLVADAPANPRAGGSSGIGLPSYPDLAQALRVSGGGIVLAANTATDTTTNTGDTPSGSSETPATTPATSTTPGGTSDTTPGNTGGGATPTQPSTGVTPVIPTPTADPVTPGEIPVVLQPTDPIVVPPKADDGKQGNGEVPEPSTLWLAGAASAALLAARRKNKR